MPWFGREKSPAGNPILRYGKEAPPTPFGVLGEETDEFTRTRESVYEKRFGEILSVSHEVFPLVPHIDVYTFRRAVGDRQFHQLVTGGMSDLPMALPRAAKELPKRVELIFYCSEPREEYIATLRWLAHFPHTYKTWVGSGHTIPNGNPPAPFWGSTSLDTILLIPPVIRKDQAIGEDLQLAGDPVSLLWTVPLTTAECNLKLEKGLDALLDLFTRHRHPYVFDPGRSSYV
jgi:hypothetical protein